MLIITECCDEQFRTFVYLCVWPRAYICTCQIFTKFLYVLPMAAARSSSWRHCNTLCTYGFLKHYKIVIGGGGGSVAEWLAGLSRRTAHDSVTKPRQSGRRTDCIEPLSSDLWKSRAANCRQLVASQLPARFQIAAAMLSGNSLRQTAYTHWASVHQAAKLVAALLRVAGVTAGLAESNGSLPPGLWLTSPAGWLPRTGISSGTLRSVIEYGLPLPFL